MFVCVCVCVCGCFFQECYKECCKKCSLANGAHCSDGPCCNNTCLVRSALRAGTGNHAALMPVWFLSSGLCRPHYLQDSSRTKSFFFLNNFHNSNSFFLLSLSSHQFYPRGYSCRYAVNDCDISETCSGDSGQVCVPNNVSQPNRSLPSPQSHKINIPIDLSFFSVPSQSP